MKTVSRTARRIFRPLLISSEPTKLDLRGISEARAIEAIREVGDKVRCTDASDPLQALYIFTSGARGAFIGPWDRLKSWVLDHF